MVSVCLDERDIDSNADAHDDVVEHTLLPGGQLDLYVPEEDSPGCRI
jgi:hypothetical protein